MKVIFVVMVMTGVLLGAGEKVEIKDLSLPEAVRTMSTNTDAVFKTLEIKDWSSQEEMHKHYIREFEKAEGFGASRIPRVDFNRVKMLIVDGQKYSFSSMQLISVTDRKKPVLWLTHGVPDRNKLKSKHVKKRLLNAAEVESFRQLENGKKFLTAKQGETLVLTGVLRAEKGCIRCHGDYSKGDLMGAFKYTLISAGLGLNKTNKEIQQKPLQKPQKQKIDKKVPDIS